MTLHTLNSTMLTTLFENLVSPQNKKFWLVFDLPNDTDERSLARLDGLAKGELHGIKGVSSSREIVTEWFQIARNACLVMDAQRCIEMNNLQEVRYRDLDSLCENNFEILRRLFNQQGPQGNYNLMSNLMFNIKRELATNDWYFEELRWRAAKKWEDDPQGIDSVKDVARFVIGVMEDAPAHIKSYYESQPFDIRSILQRALGHMGQQYEVESEWLVRSETFRVPSGSIIMVAQEKEMVSRAKKWEQNPAPIEPYKGYYKRLLRQLQNIKDFHLDDRYVLRYVDANKFAQIRTKVVMNRQDRKAA